jgi:hypothetical protein
MSLHRQRCVRHPDREAAARCPACGRFFCRECVTEHAGRLLCASCLHALAQPAGELRRFSLRTLLRPAGAAAAMAGGFFLLWGFYTLAGVLLSAIPHRFHDSTAFERLWADEAR